jgi:hypothetical protein
MTVEKELEEFVNALEERLGSALSVADDPNSLLDMMNGNRKAPCDRLAAFGRCYQARRAAARNIALHLSRLSVFSPVWRAERVAGLSG